MAARGIAGERSQGLAASGGADRSAAWRSSWARHWPTRWHHRTDGPGKAIVFAVSIAGRGRWSAQEPHATLPV